MTRSATRTMALSSVLACVLAAATPLEAAVRGDYLEARTADVWTGPCFANGEVNLAGKEAILAWRVTEGAHEGVELAGLSVVAVVRAQSTLGDPHAPSAERTSIVLVDERASAAEREALTALVRALAGDDVLGPIRERRAVPIELARGGHGEATLTVGDDGAVAEVRTRCLHAGDAHCGNEETYYPPLTPCEASPAATVVNAWRGEGLGGTWSAPNARSAFLGTFEE